jgi:hypothetical protein
MTTSIKIVNDGHYPVVVNVVEVERYRDEGRNVERLDLKPGETSKSIMIYGWRRYVNVLEAAPSETTSVPTDSIEKAKMAARNRS